MVATVLNYALLSAAVLVGLYASLLGLLFSPSCQAHAVYLHGLQMTWFKRSGTFGILTQSGLTIHSQIPRWRNALCVAHSPNWAVSKAQRSVTCRAIGVRLEYYKSPFFQALTRRPRSSVSATFSWCRRHRWIGLQNTSLLAL